MFAGVFGIFLGPAFCNNSLLNRRLVLNEFNVRNLGSGRRWNQEEKGENETSDDKREVEYVRTARRFR